MVMTPLIQHMNHPLPLNQVRVGILEDSQINAANAGGGEFYITTGLLERASDNHLRGVLAHEVAHAGPGPRRKNPEARDRFKHRHVYPGSKLSQVRV